MNTTINIIPAPISSPLYQCNGYSSALVIISDWQWMEVGVTNLSVISINSVLIGN
jgi:hypothetical protein